MINNNLKNKLRVGTSGFAFPDWAKRFYPKGLKQEYRLKYYLQFFNILELNTTFYAIPSQDRIKNLVAQLPKDFELIVKMPQTITHHYPSKSILISEIAKLTDAVSSADESGVLDGFLAQFPVSFRPNQSTHELVENILDLVPGQKYLEFRNKQWQNSDTQKLLTTHGAGWVIPDVPAIAELTKFEPILTCSKAYIRLHGRNKQNWYSSEADRYDYLYDDSEFSELIEISKVLLNMGAEKVFIFFNNCHMGQAPENALQFAKKMGLIEPWGELL